MGHRPHPESQDEHSAGQKPASSGSRSRTGSAFNVLTGEYTGSFVNVPVTYTFSETFKANFNGGWIYEQPERPAFPQLRRRRRMDSA